MEKKVLTVLTIVILIIVIGVCLVSQKSLPSSAANPQLEEVVSGLKALEKRLAAIETNTAATANVLKSFQMAAPRQAAQQPPQEDLTTVYKIDAAHSYVKGNKNAPITIVEFMDFECPFCGRFHPVVNQVLEAYPNQVNYVLKNFPLGFHQNARPAAKAALAAGEQGKYFEMVELLLQNNRDLTEDRFQQLAGELGLNVEKFLKDYKEKDSEWEDIITKDMTLATQVQVRGTPTYYLNGRKTMARDLNMFKAEVDKILSEGAKE